MKARSLWTVAPGVAEIREAVLPPPGPDQALVATRASGISRGTERLVFRGRVPESQWGAMAAPLMQGAFPFPLSYGYAAVGVVQAGPEALRGRRVFCLHPHHDAFLAPASMCVPVPDAVPDRRAVLAANMETAVNVLWDARPLVGERALVVGAGVVGLLVAFLLARVPGVDLAVCDLDPARRAIVESFGARFCAPGEAPADRDLVVHASASPEGLQLALARCGFEGRVVEASWFGDRACDLPLGEAFHAKRLALISTQVGAVAPAMRGRRTHGERLALALSLLDDPRLDALVGPEIRFAELPARMAEVLDPPQGAPQPLCPVVTYI
ncbi:zinc-dependent alcohol dehydrogenase [Falsiroseomonas oryziterrae]|uniref:zinc-dependent alcohol dehydrogenase n=1 Tax=Falsiroseomonas oryziterrae TaxID=2911368 RepID=UPI001F17AA46|nr:zinc-binding alcohol dehydrogenase [Roseomonas sp. NPKOSM-4]